MDETNVLPSLLLAAPGPGVSLLSWVKVCRCLLLWGNQPDCVDWLPVLL